MQRPEVQKAVLEREKPVVAIIMLSLYRSVVHGAVARAGRTR